MIAGSDIRIPSSAGPESMEVAVRAIRQQWPRAVFENPETGERYNFFWQIPFGGLDELFVYRDETTADKWDELGAVDELRNTMIHLLADVGMITVVIDFDDAATAGIIRVITSGLRDSILYLEAA